MPEFHSRFDWWIATEVGRRGGKGFMKCKDPETIFCDPLAIPTLVQACQALAPHRNRTIVFGGEDTKLSTANRAHLAFLASYCSRMLWEAKDVHLSIGDIRIETMPIGLTEFYYRNIVPHVNRAIAEASLEQKRGVIAAWGAWWPNENLQTRIDGSRFAEQSPLVDWRGSSVPKQDWWPLLATYRFLLYPQGNGVQSPKFCEAMLVLTIPIAERCAAFEDLRDADFPIALVESFSEITAEKLDAWWQELSPKLEPARQRYLTRNYWREFVER